MWVIISLLTLFFISLVTYSVIELSLSSLKYHAVTGTAGLVYFPWQIVASIGLVIFCVAVLVFTIRSIAIASGLIEEEGEEKKLTEVEF